MTWRSKVVWSQGMFLQPHHFQQEARHVEHLIDLRTRAAAAHAWGFFELVLDEGALSLGRLGITRASGILPDGTPFTIPQNDAAPMPLEVPADIKGEVVYLTAVLAREGVTEVDFGTDVGKTATESFRYRVVDEEVRDHTSASDEPEPVQTGAINLRLVRGRDATDGQARLGIARVLERRSDNQVVLERAYIAPQTRIEASGQLSFARLAHGAAEPRCLGDGRLPDAAIAQPRRAGVAPACRRAARAPERLLPRVFAARR
jgi:type VI secretion system protein ImpJ